MKTIAVASHNPVKLQAVRSGFERMFPEQAFTLQPISAASQVSDQPMSDEETLLGAHNRANGACQVAPGADFWVGIEGGVEAQGAEMAAFAWVVVRSNGLVGKGRTGAFYLPDAISRLVQEGKELGEADDIVFGRANSKQQEGAIGLLTGSVIDRTMLYEHAVILALVPFKNPELYTSEA